jgi:hypothetical protein
MIETPAQSAYAFNSTFQHDVHQAPSNRPRTARQLASGEGKAHAFSRLADHAQAQEPVPSVRCRDHACRD